MPNTISRRQYRSTSRLAAALLPMVLAGGCCCGSFWYDTQAYMTWAELERGVHGAATPIDEEKTGVSMQLPALFAPAEVKAMRPGGMEDGKRIPDMRLYPSLADGENAVTIKLPGMRFAYEMPFKGEGKNVHTVYCYLCVLPKGESARSETRAEILEAVQTVAPEAQWELDKTLWEEAYSADYLEVSGMQFFGPPAPPGSGQKKTPELGKLALYLVKKEHANVLVGYRGPQKIAEQVSLFKAGEAAVPTITSKQPPKPIEQPEETSQPSGDYVLAPNTEIELIPPTGYHASNAVNGFQKQGSATKMTVTTQPNPFSATAGTYNDAFFASNNVTVTSREDVTIDGSSGLLLVLTQGDTTECILVFGDEQRSYVINATIADPAADLEPVKTALKTARKKR